MDEKNLLDDQPIAWTPTPDVIKRAQLTKFMRQVGVETWDELYDFSISDVENFTEEVLKFLDIKFDPPYEKLLDTTDGIEFPRWFQRSADTPVGMSDASSRTEEADKSVGTPLETELKALVAKDMGKPLAPSKIHFVSALPKTRNAKVMRRVIRSAYLGEDPGDLSALEDPRSVDAIREAAERDW